MVKAFKPFRFIVCLLPLLIIAYCCGAQNYVVYLHSVDGEDSALHNEIKLPEKFNTQNEAFEYLQKLVPLMQSKGHLAASLDSIEVLENAYNAFVFVGNRYRWANVSFEGLPDATLLSANINLNKWNRQVLSPKQISGTSEKILQWCENNGYPFARIAMKEINTDDSGYVSGKFILERGPLKKLDSIEVTGSVNIFKTYLKRYLELQEGELYNEKKLLSISPRLKELPFLQEAQPWLVRFKLSETRLILDVKEKKANQLNALIGLIPNSVETGKFLLTVDALLALQNILGYGESINVSYQSLQYKSPRLKTDIVWLYLFNTPVGVEGHFDLYKQDTTFRRTTLQAGLRYQLNATDYIRAFYTTQSNRLITIDTAFVKAQKQLPDNADVTAYGAGGELTINHTDYRLSPRKGWQLRIAANGLKRSIIISDAITQLHDTSGFNYTSLYDSATTRKYQYIISGDASYYISLARKATIRIGYDGGYISGGQLFRNELFQIGGFKLLRGFDEQSIYASQYHIGTLELRLLLDQNSYVYLFSDNGWAASDFNNTMSSSLYNGFGIGTTLQTKTGLFTISYALGRSDNNPVKFNQSKIHFGYVAYF